MVDPQPLEHYPIPPASLMLPSTVGSSTTTCFVVESEHGWKKAVHVAARPVLPETGADAESGITVPPWAGRFMFRRGVTAPELIAAATPQHRTPYGIADPDASRLVAGGLPD